mgnify:CR=1 FL=1
MKTKKIAYLGIMLALAMIFSYVESLIPIYFGVYGMKLGLPNIVILLVLYLFGPWEAILINILRILLTGVMFTNLYSILFSLSGAICSFVVMYLLKKTKRFHMIVISVFGGIFHNAGQLLAAIWIVNNYHLSFYLPILLIAGFITGLLIGIAANEIYIRCNKIFFLKEIE